MAQSRPPWDPRTSPLRSVALLVCLLALSGTQPVAGQAQLEGPWGAGLGFEAFAGSIDFHPDLLLERQTLAGALGGLKLGRDVSLLGFYWRGTTDQLDRVEDIEGWGGEFQFDINFRGGLKPFVLAGGGRINFRDGFLDEVGLPRDPENILILGAGLAWDVNPWFRITGAARDYLIEVPEVSINPTDQPTDGGTLVSSWMFTGGLQFRLGGQPRQVGIGGGAGATAVAGAQGAAVIPVPESGEIRVSYGADAQFADQAGVIVTAEGDTIQVVGSAAAVAAVNQILQTELGYLDALFPESTSLAGGRQPVTGERADTLQRRMAHRMNEIFDYLMMIEADEIRTTLRAQLEAAGVGESATNVVLARADTVLNARLARLEVESARVDDEQSLARQRYERDKALRRFAAPYMGANFSNGGQFVVGGRVGLNTSWQQDRWAWVPEVALGFGAGGVSALVQGGLQYHVHTSRSWGPYLGLGGGFLVLSDPIGDRDGANFVFTPSVGISGQSTALAQGLGGSAWGWFAEFQGVAFFDLNRVLVGLNWAY